MEHKKYKHIDNAYREKTIDYFRMNGAFDDDIEWCVTEKIDGTNFAFYVYNEEIRAARRGDFLPKDPEEMKFFGNDAKIIFIGYKDVILEAALNEFPKDTEVIFYGEMFGGKYNHPDVDPVKGVRDINGRVHYLPDVDFNVFDICVNGNYINHDKVMEICKKYDIQTVPFLARGTFEEMIKYPNKFITKIPERYGLPEIEENYCEGVVLKPVEPMYLEETRVVLKNKNEFFSETEKKPKKVKYTPSEEIQAIIDGLHELVTESRVYSVLSKHGDVHSKDFREVWQKIKNDIYEEYGKIDLNEIELQRVDNVLGSLVADVWRPIFLRKRVD